MSLIFRLSAVSHQRNLLNIINRKGLATDTAFWTKCRQCQIQRSQNSSSCLLGLQCENGYLRGFSTKAKVLDLPKFHSNVKKKKVKLKTDAHKNAYIDLMQVLDKGMQQLRTKTNTKKKLIEIVKIKGIQTHKGAKNLEQNQTYLKETARKNPRNIYASNTVTQQILSSHSCKKDTDSGIKKSKNKDKLTSQSNKNDTAEAGVKKRKKNSKADINKNTDKVNSESGKGHASSEEKSTQHIESKLMLTKQLEGLSGKQWTELILGEAESVIACTDLKLTQHKKQLVQNQVKKIRRCINKKVPQIELKNMKTWNYIRATTDVVMASSLDRRKTIVMHLAGAKWVERKRQRAIVEAKSYVQAYVHTGMLGAAHVLLVAQNDKGKKRKRSNVYIDVSVYNIVMHGWAKKGNLHMVSQLFAKMEADAIKPDLQSFAAVLECLGRQQTLDTKIAQKVIADTAKHGYDVKNILNHCKFYNDEWSHCVKVLEAIIPDFCVNPVPELPGYTCDILKHLNQPVDQATCNTYKNPFHGAVSQDILKKNLHRQMEMEVADHITVESIVPAKPLATEIIKAREKLAESTTEWKNVLTAAFNRDVKVLEDNFRAYGTTNILPYLKLFPAEEYVQLLLQEIENIAMEIESYSPTLSFLRAKLARQVWKKFQVQKKSQSNYMQQMTEVYEKYLIEYGGETTKYANSRRQFQEFLSESDLGQNIDVGSVPYTYNTVIQIGKFLYRIILLDTQIDINMFKATEKKRMIPAFYTIAGPTSENLHDEEVRPHKTFVKMYRNADMKTLKFSPQHMPSFIPPVPWCSANIGGNLLCTIDLVTNVRAEEMATFHDVLPEQMYGVYDSLNILSATPWKINQPILDLVISIFNQDGDDSLNIPPPASACPVPDLEVLEASYLERRYFKQKREQMHSLWCAELYKLSIANKYRDEVFWFPHNLDFRGRAYTVIPHFNHLGNDVSRSLLKFAHGKQLGPQGLDWLKIHLINLTGFKKRSPNRERLAFANEMMPEVIDSADNPTTGKQWWKTSDDPWQTLACCMEIANIVRSPNPELYMSSHPVHQDGSCNGLQHYAALGRDQAGAESINLQPRDAPADVYSDIVELVEKQRVKDAADGSSIAKILDGFVRRKVIKQTVMTTVYGVTKYGANKQIRGQLKDIPEFPREHCMEGSRYLSDKTFYSLQEMFKATKEIQDWLTLSASIASQISVKPIQWVTPLGMPVKQSYFNVYQNKLKTRKDLPSMIESPNTRKQKNSFPPNFIHSLDSTHMMLTSIHCHRAGITYVSVHDCFWTHPCDVQILNKITREQFIALHSQPILEDLAQFMIDKLGFSELPSSNLNLLEAEIAKFANFVLGNVPKRGTFNLNNVLDSTYFFS